MKANLRHCAQMMLALMVVMVSATVQADRKLLDQVVAVVNDDVILQSELEARISTITGRLRAQGTGLPPQGYSGRTGVGAADQRVHPVTDGRQGRDAHQRQRAQ